MTTSGITDQNLDGPYGLPAEAERRLGYLAEDVRRRLGPGTRLGVSARAAFEGRLGGDLSGVMVHRMPLAGRLARSLGAHALSVGEHVLGGSDELDPSTSTGTALLGHELTHVLQRTPSESGEHDAQLVERALGEDAELQHPSARVAAEIDTEALTERVYQRLLDQFRLERDRAAWIP